jgi:hypothetical protein
MNRHDGSETWHRLLEWDKGQTPAERLAAVILNLEGFQNIDPSHPLGGRDELKDMFLTYNGAKWIGAVYFPRRQQSFSTIQNKFKHDLEGVKANNAQGMVFFTNQELTLGERKKLQESASDIDVLIYHLERISTILNTPQAYGIRMEYLDIEMSKDEQIAFFSMQTNSINDRMNGMNDRMIGMNDLLQMIAQKLEEKTPLELQVLQESDDAEKGAFIDKPRNLSEIAEAIEEFCDKIWFDRHLSLSFRVESGIETVNPDIWEGALKSAQRVIDKYGEENLGPYSDFEWGMLNGKLSALRWILGDEWDMLDT